MRANNHHLLLCIVLFLGTNLAWAQEGIPIPIPKPVATDTVQQLPTPQTPKDTVAQDSIKKPVLLLGKIRYTAQDYAKLSQKDQKIYLYNKAEIYYQDTELKAGIIVMDYAKNEVFAGRIKDSLGNYTQLPYFKQGENEVTPDSIRFNFDTQKALIWNSRTEQQAGLGSLGSDAMKVYAQKTKKENDSVYFMSEAKITTSKDTINPDYYIRIRKGKFVPKKKIIAGLSNLYIADVPTPIGLPFMYFPLTTGRTAGLIMPTFGNDPNRGYFLQNAGYYIPISDYVDLNLTADLYSNGSYGFKTQSVYAKRYKYRGNFNFRYENLVTSQKGFSDYSRSTIYNIQISHSKDPKSNPNSRFSAAVNLGSSQYFRNSLNLQNLPNTLNNNLSSSISYSKTFPEYPSVNVSLTASHNQNTNTESVNLTLPTLQANMERIFPFAKRDGTKKGIIQNLNFQYTVRGENKISTTDSLFLTSKMFKDARVGMKHSIPISTNFKIAKYFSVSVGGNYEDIWTLETFKKRQEEGSVIRDTIAGFDRYNKYNLSASIGTTIYGNFERGEDKKVQALRHVMRPSVSYGYSPSFEQFYDAYLDENGEMVQYSRFEGTLNGAPGLTQSSSLNFSLQNTLEAKVRSKDSSETEPKKIKLLRNLNFNASYNMQADSLRLSAIGFNGGTNIFKEKMAINFSGSFDPYAIDNNGRRINTLNMNNGGSLVRLTRASANVSYSLNSETFKKKNKDEKGEDAQDDSYDPFSAQSGGRPDDLFGSAGGFGQPGANSFEDGPSDNVDNPIYGTKIPWDLRLAYTVTYSNNRRQNEFSNNSLMFSGNVDLTPRWKVGISSGYDFKNQGFTLTQLRFARDLKSFELKFDWTPFGDYERWYFFIGIKSSILSDLKWENRSQR